MATRSTSSARRKSNEQMRPWLTAALQEDENHIYHDPRLPLQSVTKSISINPQSSENRLVEMSLHSDQSEDTAPTSISIAPLQDIQSFEGKQGYTSIAEDDPHSFDLVESNIEEERRYSLENGTELLFSKTHLEAIFADSKLFLGFTNFLSKHRPHSVPLLIYYLDARKALRAIAYSNAILDGLETISYAEFTSTPPKSSINVSLQEKADRAFAILTQEDLPAYITHVFVDVVSNSIQRKITGTMSPHLLQASEGLAEVFCMSDISKPDCPIVFSSEEFHRTTQYGLHYAVGRNCRFLQGPRTSPFSIERLREAIRNGREHQEILLNYRRDGSPFMNLLTIAPLVDNQGKLRYFIGAQVDVSGLVKEGVNLEAFAKLAAEQDLFSGDSFQVKPYNDLKDEFQSLCEMFNQSELETTRTHGGRMHSEQHELDDTRSGRTTHRPRLRLGDTSDEQDYEASITGTHSPPPQQHNFTLSGSPGPITGKLPGVFKHYVILRPFPSLRITFTSPSLRYPGLLQSPFLSRIGGSARVRDELTSALSEGRNVTAKIRWLSSGYDESVHSNIDDHTSPTPYSSLAGKPRWIHCTPLIGSNRAIGVWMVIMIDVDEYDQEKMNHQSERNRVTSPSWSRASPSNNNNNSNNNSNNTDSRTQTSSGQTYREQKQQSQQLPIAAPSSLHNTEWDLDFDIASASVNQSTGNLPRRTESKSQRLRSQTLALAPPPSKAIPHPPLPNSNTHISDPTSSREAYSIPLTTRTSSKQQQQSPSAPSLPLSSLSTFRPRSPGPNSLQDGTLTNAIQAGFSHNIPRTPSMKSGKTSEAFAFNQTPSLQPQRYEQPQQRSNQPSKSSLRLTPKTSTDGLRKDTQSQSHTGMGLGHRVLQGFRRSSDRDKEGGAGGGGERKDRSRRG